jgi:hypothetical protein
MLLFLKLKFSILKIRILLNIDSKHITYIYSWNIVNNKLVIANILKWTLCNSKPVDGIIKINYYSILIY